MAVADLNVQVVAVKGICPIFGIGDSFVILEGFKLCANKPLCMHSLAAILPFYAALSRGVSPVSLGLAREGESAYLQCSDPCEWTGGGTVVFRLSPSPSP